MESEEEIDDFDLLNEGLMAMQIMEWFEREHPEPEMPKDLDDHVAWKPWDKWHWDLITYAAGWKDALKAIEIEYEELEGVYTIEDALREDAVQIREKGVGLKDGIPCKEKKGNI